MPCKTRLCLVSIALASGLSIVGAAPPAEPEKNGQADPAPVRGARPAEDYRIAQQRRWEQFMAVADPLLKRIKSPVVYEGLPHQVWEKELLRSELASKKTRKLYGYDFYEAPIRLDEPRARKLLATLAEPKLFQPYEGKFCSFHPDWAVQWKDSSGTYALLLCFGCHEAAFFRKDEKLVADLTEGGYQKLAKTMSAFRTARPPTESGAGH